jgi:ArsR family transcriptional regulator
MAEVQITKPKARELGERCCADTLRTQFGRGQIASLSEQLQHLAHPVRLQILQMLALNPGKVCVCDLEAAVPVKQPTISHHLKLLREAGLVEAERDGLWVYYSVRREAFDDLRKRVTEMLEALG